MVGVMNPDNIIPPDSELGLLLAQLTEDTDSRTWKVANICNELIEEVAGGSVTKADIYKAVATRCKGQKPNTIRRIAEVAADFDYDTQEQYAQLLSFSHFKTARRLFQEGHTPYLNYALEWCIEGNDDKITAGKFHTVGQMLEQFLPSGTFEDKLSKFWKNKRERLYDLILIHDHDIQREAMLKAFDALDSAIRSSTEVTLDNN